MLCSSNELLRFRKWTRWVNIAPLTIWILSDMFTDKAGEEKLCQQARYQKVHCKLLFILGYSGSVNDVCSWRLRSL